MIELISRGILFWRLSVKARGSALERVKRAKRRAAWVVAVSLVLLSVYVLESAGYGLLIQEKPDSSPVGIAIILAAVLIMPGLGIIKRRIAACIDSGALREDAASSFTCGLHGGHCPGWLGHECPVSLVVGRRCSCLDLSGLVGAGNTGSARRSL